MPVTLRLRGMTPVRVERMLPFLSKYPDRGAARFLESGFTEGFKIPCSLAIVPPMARNLKSALQHQEVVGNKNAEGSGVGSHGRAVCQ